MRTAAALLAGLALAAPAHADVMLIRGDGIRVDEREGSQ